MAGFHPAHFQCDLEVFLYRGELKHTRTIERNLMLAQKATCSISFAVAALKVFDESVQKLLPTMIGCTIGVFKQAAHAVASSRITNGRICQA